MFYFAHSFGSQLCQSDGDNSCSFSFNSFQFEHFNFTHHWGLKTQEQQWAEQIRPEIKSKIQN